MVSSKLMTADELLHLPDDGWKYELVEGVLIRMSPPGGLHARLEARLTARLDNFVEEHRLGEVYAGDGGVIFGRDPDTVLAPDVAFIRADRLPRAADEEGFLSVVPDLAVEIRSPSNSTREITEKVRRYLDGGVQVVWIVEPARRTVIIHEAGKEPVRLGEHDVLDGGSVLPGFRLPLGGFWERVPRR